MDKTASTSALKAPENLERMFLDRRRRPPNGCPLVGFKRRRHPQAATISLLSLVCASHWLAVVCQLDIEPSGGSVQHQEILVQPNSQVRIECRLPQTTATNQRLFYWNFQRSAINAAKPYVLCFESKCVDETTFGIQLDMDRDTGAYDLLINNVTYELNDGLYYCDYKDSSPESKQTINREFKLTVLSK